MCYQMLFFDTAPVILQDDFSMRQWLFPNLCVKAVLWRRGEECKIPKQISSSIPKLHDWILLRTELSINAARVTKTSL